MPLYNAFKQKLLQGTHDLDTDTTFVMLVTSAYTPDYDNHDFRNDVTNEVSAGGGYSTGGKTIGVVTAGMDAAGDFGYIDAPDVTWSTSTITARGAVLYKSRGGASSADELIGYIDFGSDKSSSGGDFTIQWATPANGGVLKLA